MLNGLTSGELAKQGQVKFETIRFYEQKGLLPPPPRTHSGYRIFSDDSVKRLRFIKHAQDLGFSLKEIKELLALRVRPGSSCVDVRRKAETKIVDVEAKIRNLEGIKKALRSLTATCAGKGPVSTCSILEALEEGSF